MNDFVSEYGLAEPVNGNGKPKAFTLAQPKTADEIRRDVVRSAMPKARRDCARDKRLRRFVGAKWLFSQISDLTFLDNFGGDGAGRVRISIHDLERLFHHTRESLRLWRDKLIETGWIWYVEGWPKAQWGVCAVTRQPELFPTAATPPIGPELAEEGGAVEPPPLGESEKSAESAQNRRLNRPGGAEEPPATGGGTAQSRGREPPEGGGGTAHNRRRNRPV